MNKEQKLKLLERLVKEGHITLAEAFDLSETEKEYITVPNQIDWFPANPNPWIQPYNQPTTITFSTHSTL